MYFFIQLAGCYFVILLVLLVLSNNNIHLSIYTGNVIVNCLDYTLEC